MGLRRQRPLQPTRLTPMPSRYVCVCVCVCVFITCVRAWIICVRAYVWLLYASTAVRAWPKFYIVMCGVNGEWEAHTRAIAK